MTADPDAAYAVAAKHAATCRRCSMPIVDDDGNPGYFGEACPEGLPLLIAYVRAIGGIIPRYLETPCP